MTPLRLNTLAAPDSLSTAPPEKVGLNARISVKLALVGTLSAAALAMACGSSQDQQFSATFSGGLTDGTPPAEGDGDGETGEGMGSQEAGDGDGDSMGDGDGDDDSGEGNPTMFDVLSSPDAEPEWVCNEPEPPTPCDADIPVTDAPATPDMILRSLGICEGEFDMPLLPGYNFVYPGALKVIDKMGTSGLWVPEPGFNRMLAMSSGWVNSMLSPDGNYGDVFQDFLDPENPALPYVFSTPYERNDLGQVATCPDDAGEADCSNSLYKTVMFDNQEISVDYYDSSYITLKGKVPEDKNAVIITFSFHSLEDLQGNHVFNDSFIAYLVVKNENNEEIWTGNMAFNNMGQPITVSGLNGQIDHEPGPDYAGTRLEVFSVGGGTDGLQATAPVPPGKEILVRFGSGDVGDGDLNSIVLVSSVRFGCTDIDGPVTQPAG